MARSWYPMHLSRRPVIARAAPLAGVAALLLARLLPAAELAVTRVDFTPALNARLQEYGAAEAATVRAAIVAAIASANRQGSLPRGLAVAVTVLDLAPSRPTRKQLSDDPTLDVVHSRSLGGAELKGEVRDAQQHLLRTVSYRYFPPTIALGSPARDPWADARVAIEGFAEKLAAACRELPHEAAQTNSR